MTSDLTLRYFEAKESDNHTPHKVSIESFIKYHVFIINDLLIIILKNLISVLCKENIKAKLDDRYLRLNN